MFITLAEAFCAQEINVLGFDIDATKIELLAANKSYISIPDAIIAKIRDANIFHATDDFSKLSEVDVTIICVPTHCRNTVNQI